MPDDPAFYPRVARHVDKSGFDLLFVGDHLLPTGENPDALALLAMFAGVTERVQLGTGVLLLPLRDPVVVAKQAATIDLVSGGRLILGVGVGGEFEWEWNAMGVSPRGRGARTDEYLDIVQQLWTGEPVEHPGPLRPITGVRGSPLPARTGGPPIWIGGRSEPALVRASRYDGWCAYAVSTRRLRSSIERLTELRGDLDGFRVSMVLFTSIDDDARRARDVAAQVLGSRYRQDFDHFIDAFCAVGTPDHVAERIEMYRANGVDDVLLSPQVPAAMFEEQVHRLGEIIT